MENAPFFFSRRCLRTWIVQPFVQEALPIGSIVVPCCGSYIESYKVVPKRDYYGAYGQARDMIAGSG